MWLREVKPGVVWEEAEPLEGMQLTVLRMPGLTAFAHRAPASPP
jgi:hypothetical protein